MEKVRVINATMELKECADRWTLDEQYGCWCLEDVLYTERADVPAFQRLSVFVPEQYMNSDGMPAPESRTVPIVFENNAAGYMQMPNTWLGGPRCYAEQYLKHGLIVVSCGCRGRDSRNTEGKAVGKAPVPLIDLKTAIRFLRHNREALPGDFGKIISIGWSAGGAMSALLGITGDHPDYNRYLAENGAFMDESDAVFAAQVYCPIIDLEHADLAYEWCFGADPVSEDSPAGPAETMTPFKKTLSIRLAEMYVDYVNRLQLRHPVSGKPLTLDGVRSGSFLDYLMNCLNESAADFLSRLDAGKLSADYSTADYLCGNYSREVPMHAAGAGHHAGPGVSVDEAPQPMGLGEMLQRRPGAQVRPERKMMTETRPGTDKRGWLSWDGKEAVISDLDTYVLSHRGRMKPCTSFDKLTNDSGENHLFGTDREDYRHFCEAIGDAVRDLREAFPQETGALSNAFDISGDGELKRRIHLLNPMDYISTDRTGKPAQHYRIRVGACDADTSFTVSMALAVKLANAGYSADYALVWDQPHSEADYPGEVLAWIDAICR